jgi:hypothetical protein
MFRNFYKFLIETKLGGKDLFDNLNLADKYGKINENSGDLFERSEGKYVFGVDYESPLFFRVDKSTDTYCCFYENLMFTFFYDGKTKDKITRIYVKSPSDEWTFAQTDDMDAPIDLMHPTNVCAEVYVNYDVSVLQLNRCFGSDYKSGSWNKMFYRTLISFFEKTQGYTELNRIKAAYQK